MTVILPISITHLKLTILLQEGLALDSSDLNAVFTLANVKLEMGDADQAIPLYERVLQDGKSTDTLAMLNLSVALARTKQLTKAKGYLLRVLVMNDLEPHHLAEAAHLLGTTLHKRNQSC